MPTIKPSASLHKHNSYSLHTDDMFSTHVKLSHFNRFSASGLSCRSPSFLYFHHLELGYAAVNIWCVCVRAHVCMCLCVCYTFVDKPNISVTGIKPNTIRVVVMMMTSSRWRPDFVIGSSSCRDSTSKTDYWISPSTHIHYRVHRSHHVLTHTQESSPSHHILFLCKINFNNILRT